MPFQSLLASANLPPPGPEHFAARRALWTTPTAASRLDQTTSPSSVKLEGPGTPGALEGLEVWDAGPLPLRTVIKFVHASWRRDGTWPENATVIDVDDFFGTMDTSANAAPSLAKNG